MTEMPTVLVVDDEVRSLETLSRVLAEEFTVLAARSADHAEQMLDAGEPVRVILCDQRMPGITGVEFLKKVRACWPDPVRMVISGYTDSEDIIESVNEAGIYRYITKPWDPPALLDTVRGAVALSDLQRDAHNASVEMKQTAAPIRAVLADRKKSLRARFGFERILRGPGSPLEETCLLAERACRYDVSVLITGESGTGKELLARAIHYGSARSDKPFVVENCGALPDELLESELFGCKKGAFTGAYEDRIGLFEQADGGSIFLDEIGETSPAFQVKLLRVLQEGEIRPLGGAKKRRVNVRVISATNRNLERDVFEKRFREDLFYRLAAFPLHVPPLRERPMDIEVIAAAVLDQTMRAYDRRGLTFSAEVLERFCGYPWPGNVRELQNEIQRLAVLCESGRIKASQLSAKLRNSVAADGRLNGPPPLSPSDRSTESGGEHHTLKTQVEALERRILGESMFRHRNNISRVAEDLGLSRVGLRGKLKRYGLAPNAIRREK